MWTHTAQLLSRSVVFFTPRTSFSPFSFICQFGFWKFTLFIFVHLLHNCQPLTGCMSARLSHRLYFSMSSLRMLHVVACSFLSVCSLWWIARQPAAWWHQVAGHVVSTFLWGRKKSFNSCYSRTAVRWQCVLLRRHLAWKHVMLTGSLDFSILMQQGCPHRLLSWILPVQAVKIEKVVLVANMMLHCICRGGMRESSQRKVAEGWGCFLSSLSFSGAASVVAPLPGIWKSHNIRKGEKFGKERNVHFVVLKSGDILLLNLANHSEQSSITNLQ